LVGQRGLPVHNNAADDDHGDRIGKDENSLSLSHTHTQSHTQSHISELQPNVVCKAPNELYATMGRTL